MCRFRENITGNIFMEFNYNDSKPYSDNFSTWFGLNTKERLGNGEKPLTSIIAKRKFGHKVLTEPKFGYSKTLEESNNKTKE
jgi:hypothetical protein